jgi:hypothetical protein
VVFGMGETGTMQTNKDTAVGRAVQGFTGLRVCRVQGFTGFRFCRVQALQG